MLNRKIKKLLISIIILANGTEFEGFPRIMLYIDKTISNNLTV
jgi:hypothetical protein